MNFLYNKTYQSMIKKQLKELLLFLLQNSVEFRITTNTNGIEFVPPLPDELANELLSQQFSVFIISGFTFKSAFIEDNKFIFKAGFGPQNFVSVVYIDIDRILKIEVENNPLFINLLATLDKIEKVDSLKVFASKERNKKFFKKKKSDGE